MSKLASLSQLWLLSLLIPLTAQAQKSPDKVPARVATWIHASYKDNAQAEGNTRRLFQHSVEEFEKHWSAYQARRKEVATAIADAEAKQAKGDVDGAIATLRGVITKVELDPSKSVKRQMVEARDAELPAIAALLEIAAAKHDYTLAFDLTADLAVRRRVTDDIEAERLRWIAFRNRTALENLAAGMTQDTFKEIKALTSDADEAALDGKRLATGVGGSLRDLGVHFAAFYDAKSAKPGDWVFATLSKAKIDGKKLTFHLIDETPIVYDCHDTGKIDYLNPVTGVVVWQQACKSKPNKVEWWLEAALAQDAPAAAIKPYTTFGLIGQVEKAGPHWKLATASVVNLEIARSLSACRPDEGETFGAGGKIDVEKR